MRRASSLFLPLFLLGLTACGSSDECTVDETYDPSIDPADFTNSTTIDNPLLPLVPGTAYSYVGARGGTLPAATPRPKPGRVCPQAELPLVSAIRARRARSALAADRSFSRLNTEEGSGMSGST
jgi:hypothetical protein